MGIGGSLKGGAYMGEVFKKRPLAMISALMCAVLFLVGIYGCLANITDARDAVILSFVFLAITGFLSWTANG